MAGRVDIAILLLILLAIDFRLSFSPKATLLVKINSGLDNFGLAFLDLTKTGFLLI